MNEELTEIEALLSLFEEREMVLEYTTNRIFETIAPTVLESLSEVFDMPVDSIGWENVLYVNGILLIECTILFNPNSSSEFIAYVFRDDPNPQSHERRVTIGFPIAHVFKPKEFLIEFLRNNVFEKKDNKLVDIPQKIKDNLHKFDNNMLTEEQLKQFELFSHKGSGVKH